MKFSMTPIIIICRMGSTRLPGKTLLQFGDYTLLGHIISRAVNYCADAKVVVCTSDKEEDLAIQEFCDDANIACYRGDPLDVSARVYGCAKKFQFESFVCALGDNPWVDYSMASELLDSLKRNSLDYLVTPTPELLTDIDYYGRLFPIGTRLQAVNTNYLNMCLQMELPLTIREHLYHTLKEKNAISYDKIYEPDKLSLISDVEKINISINTQYDYERAQAALSVCGHFASVQDIYRFYLSNRKA